MSDDERLEDLDAQEEDDDDVEEAMSTGDDQQDEEEYEIDAEYNGGDWIDAASEQPKSKQKDFKVMDAEELINNQQTEVLNVAEVLGVPVGAAGTCLRAYGWDKEKLFTEFFEDSKKVCKKVKVNLDDFTLKRGAKGTTVECSVCYDDQKGEDMLALSCKHFLCRGCWKGYLETAIKDGPGCLHTKCPYPKCESIVDEALVKELVDPVNFKLYSKYLARSFVDDNPRIRWCPAPDCGRAVFCPESITDVVECACGNKFCFKCSREAHAPGSCDEMTAWIKKERDESETANWLTANTKVL